MRKIGAYKLGVEIDVSGDTSAKSKLNAIDRSVGSLHKGFSQLGSVKGVGQLAGSLTGLGGIASVAAVGLTAVLTAGVALGAGLFALTKQTADFGSEIFDASQKTGIHAEALSALKFATDQSGGSMELLTTGVGRFSKTVGEASRGSDEAKAKLQRLGVDPQKAITDLEGALATAFKTIADAPEGIQRTNAAIDAFGKGGAAVIPTILSFDGKLEDLIKRAKELGVTLTDEDAKAADKFGDTIDTLGAQVKGLGYQFAREFMPTIQNVMDKASGWMISHQGTVRAWGQNVGSFVEGAARAIEKYMADSNSGLKTNAENWQTHGESVTSSIVMIADAIGGLTVKLYQAVEGWKYFFGGMSNKEGVGNSFLNKPQAPQSPPGSYLGSLSNLPFGTPNPFRQKSPGEVAEETRLARQYAGGGVTPPGSTYDVAGSAKGGGAGDAAKKAAANAIKALEVRRKEAKRIYDQEVADAKENVAAIITAENKLHTELTKINKEQRDIELKAAAKDKSAGLIIISEAGEEELQLTANKTKAITAITEAAAKDALSLFLQIEERKEELSQMIDARTLARIEDNEERKLVTHERAEEQRSFIIDAAFTRRREMLDKELAASKGDAKAHADIQHKINVLEEDAAAEVDDAERRKRAAAKKTADEIEEHHKRQLKLWDAEIKAHEEKWDQQTRDAEEARRAIIRAQEESAGGLGGGLAGMVGSSVEEIQAIGGFGVALQSAADMGVGALQSVGSMLGEIVGQWTMLGDQADINMRKMTAAVLAGLASQAASMAVFFTAMGVVSLTPWGAAIFGPAVPWFQGAALMAGIAVVAAGAGRLVAGNASAGASGGAQSPEQASQAYADPNNPENQFGRATLGAAMAGSSASRDNATADALNRLAAAIEPIESAPADAWFRMGSKGNERLIGEASTTALQKNSDLQDRMGRALNLATT